MLHYYIRRIKRFKNLNEVADIVERYFGILDNLPHSLIPKYFTDFIIKFWNSIEYTMTKSNNRFERELYIATNQFIAHFPH